LSDSVAPLICTEKSKLAATATAFFLGLWILAGSFCAAQFPETRVTDDWQNQFHAELYGHWLVWLDYRTYDWDVWAYDLRTGEEFPVCTGAGTTDLVAVYGDIVVWRDDRNGNWDIYGKNLARGEEFPVCTEPHEQWRPAILGDIIVWQDERNGDWDIYGLDLATGRELPLVVAPGDQEFPSVYYSTMVWADSRSGNFDIWTMQIPDGQPHPLVEHAYTQSHPVVYGDYVVWRDDRNAHCMRNWDIYGLNSPRCVSSPYALAPETSGKPISAATTSFGMTPEQGSGTYGVWISKRRSPVPSAPASETSSCHAYRVT
jgi:beta propeller repeat protein